jgi:hypothetical protein
VLPAVARPGGKFSKLVLPDFYRCKLPKWEIIYPKTAILIGTTKRPWKTLNGHKNTEIFDSKAST